MLMSAHKKYFGIVSENILICLEGIYNGQSERKLYKSKDLGNDSGGFLRTKKVAQAT